MKERVPHRLPLAAAGLTIMFCLFSTFAQAQGTANPASQDLPNMGRQITPLAPPNSVSFSSDGSCVYAVNGKSPTGANSGFCYSGGAPDYPNCIPANQYSPQLLKAGLQTFPRPTSAQLTTLTAQVAVNNRITSTESASDAAVMAAVRAGVQHVVFILKENRTYDQILGDLEVGNGDPDLTEFGQAVTPNQYNLATTFVTLDNFMVTAKVSNDGWPWSTSARAPDVIERQYPVFYSSAVGVSRGLSIDSEGVNRNVNVALATLAERRYADPFTPNDPDLLPGQTNVAAPDGPDNEINTGFLWDAARRANLRVRNYGFFVDQTRYNTTTNTIPLIENPAADGIVVAYPTNVALAPRAGTAHAGRPTRRAPVRSAWPSHPAQYGDAFPEPGSSIGSGPAKAWISRRKIASIPPVSIASCGKD